METKSMKTRHLIKTLGSGVLVAAALVFSSSANAVPTVTQLIHFDDAGNGDKWYSDADNNFLFTPTNLQSATLCADSTNGGNGSCVIETTQGLLPRMTRPENGPYVDTQPGPGVTLSESQGSANKDPVVTGANLAFTLDSFYFLLTGNGMGSENAITVTGSNEATFTFALDGNYDPMITFYEGANAGNQAGNLMKNTGYIATFGDLFADVTWIQFSAPTTAQVRLDCVVATFGGTTTQPLSSFNGGCGGSTQIPEPAILALLSIGLLGIGAARKLKKH